MQYGGRNDCWRVKLYQLATGGVWIDKGTGFVSCQHSPSDCTNTPGHSVSYNASLVVKREDDNSTLLQSAIQYEDAYERQGESIIMWRELCAETNQDIDYALSFQDTAGCYGIWEAIMDMQALNCTVAKSIDHDTFGVTLSPSPLDLASSYIGLPGVAVESLDEIKDKVSSAFPSQKEVYASVVLDKNGEYLRNLLKISAELQRSENIVGCQRVAEIIRGIVYLNDPAVVDLVIDNEIFPLIAKAMEYDPQLREQGNYSQSIAPNGPQCVLGIGFGSECVGDLVLKLYRVKVLKDQMMRPLLDETGASALNSVVHALQGAVCSEIFGNEEYLRRLLEVIDSDPGSADKHMNGGLVDGNIGNGERSQQQENFLQAKRCLGLLRELFFMTRLMSIEQRGDMYSICIGPLRQLFTSAIMRTLCRRTDEVEDAVVPLSGLRLLAAEILSSVTQACTSAIHQTVLEGPIPGPPPYLAISSSTRPIASPPNNDLCLMFVVIERLLNDPESAVVEHLGETVKTLLDPERLDKSDKERFLTVFYDYYMPWLLVPFADNNRSPDSDCSDFLDSSEPSRQTSVVSVSGSVQRRNVQTIGSISSSRRCVCDIFSLCVSCHSYRMKYFIMKSNVMSRVLKLLHSSFKHLHICALKFIRSVLSVKDEFYYRHIVKFDIMKPVFDLFKEIFTKDTLVTSEIIEIVDFIRSERIHSLISYVVLKHRKSFSACIGEEDNSGHCCLHSEVFEKLIVTYEQLEDGSGLGPRGGGASQGSSSSATGTEGSFGLSADAVKQNRQMNEMDSEEAYFYGDSDSDEESYGPHPHRPAMTSDDEEKEAAAGRKSGYFAGLRSNLVVSPIAKENPPPHAQTDVGQNSLSLISELYNDMDGDNDGKSNGSEDGNSASPLMDSIPPLPPLRAKYSCDDDDDLDDNIFARSMMPTKNKVHPGSLDNGAEVSGVASDEAVGASKPPNVSGGAITFSMTKKKQRIF